MSQDRPKARVVGLGKYVPERILDNEELSTMVDTNDEWIVSRTGMKERHIAREDELTSDMAVEAAKVALANAEIAPEELDLIILASMTGDYPAPATAGIVEYKLGAGRIGAVDVGAACGGMLYALSMAKAYIESGMYRKVLVIAAEKMSAVTDYTDRSTCILFGDGAAAMVVADEGPGFLIDNVVLGTDGEKAELGMVPGGGCKHPVSQYTIDNKLHYFRMEGREVFKHAVRRMESAARECLEKSGLTDDQISWVVPHQANQRIIDAMAKRFGDGNTRVYNEVHRYGNTSAASVGLAMYDLWREQEFEVNEHFLLVVFGVGLTWGACVLTKIEG